MVFKTTVGLKQGNKGFHVFLGGEGIRTKYLIIGYLDPLGNIASTISVPEACFRQRGFLLRYLRTDCVILVASMNHHTKHILEHQAYKWVFGV